MNRLILGTCILFAFSACQTETQQAEHIKYDLDVEAIDSTGQDPVAVVAPLPDYMNFSSNDSITTLSVEAVDTSLMLAPTLLYENMSKRFHLTRLGIQAGDFNTNQLHDYDFFMIGIDRLNIILDSMDKYIPYYESIINYVPPVLYDYKMLIPRFNFFVREYILISRDRKVYVGADGIKRGSRKYFKANRPYIKGYLSELTNFIDSTRRMGDHLVGIYNSILMFMEHDIRVNMLKESPTNTANKFYSYFYYRTANTGTGVTASFRQKVNNYVADRRELIKKEYQIFVVNSNSKLSCSPHLGAYFKPRFHDNMTLPREIREVEGLLLMRGVLHEEDKVWRVDDAWQLIRTFNNSYKSTCKERGGSLRIKHNFKSVAKVKQLAEDNLKKTSEYQNTPLRVYRDSRRQTFHYCDLAAYYASQSAFAFYRKYYYPRLPKP